MAEKELQKLDPSTKETIVKKLAELKHWNLLEKHLKQLHNLEPATHRIRIGHYRLIVKKTDTTILVYTLWHRKDIYK